MKFSNVMLNSENPTKLAEFYTAILGEPGWHEGEWFGYQSTAGLMIGPHSEVKGKSQTPARVMLGFICDDVEADFKKLAGLGAAVVAKPYHPNDDASVTLATVEDPDGNYVQLSTPWPS